MTTQLVGFLILAGVSTFSYVSGRFEFSTWWAVPMGALIMLTVGWLLRPC